MKKLFICILGLALTAMSVMAQTSTKETMNPLITAMPSLTIAPDARGAGMGDAGVATNPDLNAQHYNPAKYAFMESQGGITVNYTPWLRKLVSDIDLAYIAGYYNISDMAGAIGASFTYFSLGEVSLRSADDVDLGVATPNEWALDLSYSRKLHEYVSMGVALRFMYSDLNNGANVLGGLETRPGWTMAADVALYYKQPIELPMGTSYVSAGLNVSNLGGKITYNEDNTKSFIPANFRLGASYELAFDNYNRLSATVECNKLLVPSRKSKFAVDSEGNPYPDNKYPQNDWNNLSAPRGWAQSFADAPGGAAEEFREVTWSAGLEYSYNRQFFGRVGYSHEAQDKGNRRYFTLGTGFHLSIFNLDVAYCIATHPSIPLDQTLRFTVGFDLAGIKDLVNNRR